MKFNTKLLDPEALVQYNTGGCIGHQGGGNVQGKFNVKTFCPYDILLQSSYHVCTSIVTLILHCRWY